MITLFSAKKYEESSTTEQNEQDPFKNNIHLQFGAIAGSVLILLFVLYYVMGWNYDRDYKSWIPSIVFMLLIVAAQFKHTSVVDDSIPFGNLFAKGFKTAAVGTCIYVLFLVLFIWLDPGYKERMLSMSKQNMIEQGLTSEEIKSGMAMARDYFLSSAISGAVLGELLLGVIASLAGAAAAPKHKKPELKSLS
ncbi:MAG TPA: DUF4199 domain-containing protein [Chitinophagaceae bacterium]|nr:DUF4199 domain-containing protein [Chitinophagaceae bacterium]